MSSRMVRICPISIRSLLSKAYLFFHVQISSHSNVVFLVLSLTGVRVVQESVQVAERDVTADHSFWSNLSLHAAGLDLKCWH